MTNRGRHSKLRPESWVVRVVSHKELRPRRRRDQDDFRLLPALPVGNGVAYGSGCAPADLDTNGAVDQTDFGLFWECMAGPVSRRGVNMRQQFMLAVTLTLVLCAGRVLAAPVSLLTLGLKSVRGSLLIAYTPGVSAGAWPEQRGTLRQDRGKVTQRDTEGMQYSCGRTGNCTRLAVARTWSIMK